MPLPVQPQPARTSDWTVLARLHFIGTDILGKSSTTSCAGQIPKDLIARLKLLDITTNCLDPPGDIAPEYLVFGLKKTSRYQADKEWARSHHVPVTRIDGCRMNFDQYVIIFWSRFFHLLELKNIRQLPSFSLTPVEPSV